MMKNKYFMSLILTIFIYCTINLAINLPLTFSQDNAFLALCKLEPVVLINDKGIDFGDNYPEIIDGKIYLPARVLAENINASLTWQPDASTLKVAFKDKTAIFDYRNNCYYFTSAEKKIQMTMFFKNRVAYIPVSAISNEFGLNVTFAKDNEEWPVLDINSDIEEKNVEKASCSRDTAISNSKERIKAKVLEMISSFQPKFNNNSIVLKGFEQVGNRLMINIEKTYDLDYKIYWSQDKEDGTHVWESVPYQLNESCPKWYSWNVGEHKVSARVNNGYADKVITTTIKVVQRNGKTVYLTFDDGPNDSTILNMDTLKSYNYHATFFLIFNKKYAHFHKPTIERVFKEGHSLGLHGSSHSPSEVYNSDNSVLQCMSEANNILYNLFGFKTYLCRLPYGTKLFATVQQFNNLKNAGYKIWDWNVESSDSVGPNLNPNVIAKNTINGIKDKNESIILMHDRLETTKALPLILKYIQDNGYDVRLITESMSPKSFKGGQLVPPAFIKPYE